MPAPIKKDSTGNPKRFTALLLLLLLIGGTLFYASLLPAKVSTLIKDDSPQVAGVKTTADEPIEEEEVAPEDIIPAETPASDQIGDSYQVTEVVDGDTIKVDITGKTETVRLIGVDTPETKDPRKKVQCFGAQASSYSTTNLIGKSIRLEADDSQDNRDKYGRLLRYIILSDGTNFNGRLIADGYAYEYTYKVAYKYQEEFKTFQSQAEADQKGLWSPSTCNGTR